MRVLPQFDESCTVGFIGSCGGVEIADAIVGGTPWGIRVYR